MKYELKLCSLLLASTFICGCTEVDTSDAAEKSDVSATESAAEYDTSSSISEITNMTHVFSETETESSVIETAAESSETVTENALSEKSFKADNGHTKLSGRTIEDENGVRWLGYTCSSVSFSFTGTKAEITLIPDNTELEERYAPHFMILVNGMETVRQTLSDRETFTVFESEEPAYCEVEVIKLSEASFSAVGIENISVTSVGEAVPLAESERKIEFIGDSLTCGYGVLAPDVGQPFRTIDEDGTKAYAYMTAQAVSADCNIVAMNGIGIVSRYSSKHEKNADDFLMTELYRYTDGFRSKDIEWDNSTFVPDICVIALGANDNSYTNHIPERENEFREEYKKFISSVREKNPNAYILCVSGIQQSNLAEVISAAADEYSTENSDDRVSFFKFNSQRAEEGYGTDYHPSALSQRRFSEELTEHLRLIMEW